MKNRTDTAIEDEVDAIRQEIWEEIKDMTSAERSAYFRVQTEPVMRQFNIKSSPLRPVPPAAF